MENNIFWVSDVSVQSHRLTSIWIPIIKIRWSHDRLIYTMEIIGLEMQFLYSNERKFSAS